MVDGIIAVFVGSNNESSHVPENGLYLPRWQKMIRRGSFQGTIILSPIHTKHPISTMVKSRGP
jgi:hypothetical protein